MNHESLGKNKEGIMNNEGQMIPLPPPTLRLEAMVILIYEGHQTNGKTLSRIKIKHFPRRTGKRKYLSTSSRYNIFP